MPLGLSIIPFVLHLMLPVPFELQGIFGSKFTIHPLTPTKISSINSDALTFTAKLGPTGGLPVPLFAQLERSMSNMAKIYHQYKDGTNGIKRVFLYNENCEGKIKLTEDVKKATVFEISSTTEGTNFYISCIQTVSEENSEGSGMDMQAMPTTWKKLALSTNKAENHKLDLVIEDKSIKYYSLIGMITPYYMQDK